MSEVALGIFVTIFAVFCLTLLRIIRMFIYSKPPGRRLVNIFLEFYYVNTDFDIQIFPQVTADIHAISATAFQLLVVSALSGSIFRAFLGPMPFLAVFILSEFVKVSLSFFFGLLNVSAFVQVCIIMDIRDYIYEYIHYKSTEIFRDPRF